MTFDSEEKENLFNIILCPPRIEGLALRDLESKIPEWLKLGAEVHLLDFKNTEFLDDNSYPLFVKFKRGLTEQQKILASMKMQPQIRKQVKNSGLDSVFTPVVDIEAVKNLAQQAKSKLPLNNVKLIAQVTGILENAVKKVVHFDFLRKAKPVMLSSDQIVFPDGIRLCLRVKTQDYVLVFNVDLPDLMMEIFASRDKAGGLVADLGQRIIDQAHEDCLKELKKVDEVTKEVAPVTSLSPKYPSRQCLVLLFETNLGNFNTTVYSI